MEINFDHTLREHSLICSQVLFFGGVIIILLLVYFNLSAFSSDDFIVSKDLLYLSLFNAPFLGISTFMIIQSRKFITIAQNFEQKTEPPTENHSKKETRVASLQFGKRRKSPLPRTAMKNTPVSQE